MTLYDSINNSPSYNYAKLERFRAHQKHNVNGNSMEGRSYTDPMWLPVLTEEIGEVARAICDSSSPLDLLEELVQVMAMASAWIDSIEAR